MKATINGIEIEGTVDEIDELLKIYEKRIKVVYREDTSDIEAESRQRANAIASSLVRKGSYGSRA